MAVSHKWVGGATKVAQVDQQIYATATPLNTETTTYTLTDENNVAHVLIHTFSGTPADIEAGRDQLLAALQASGSAEFKKITWSESGTDTILGTAKDKGRPFHLVVTEAAAWTVTDNDDGDGGSTANAGPNAWATLANWETATGAGAGSLPGTAADIFIAEGDDSILYDLVTGVTDADTLVRSANFTGSVGDPLGDGDGNPYPLRIDLDELVTNDGRQGGAFIWRGTCPDLLWTGGSGAGLNFYVAGDVNNFRAVGVAVSGRVHFANAMVLDNLYVAGVRNAVFDIGVNITSFDLIDADSGSILARTNPAAVNVNGTAFLELSGTEDWTGDVTNRGGRILYTGEGDQNTPGEWFQTAGSTTLRPRSSVALFDVTVLGGSFSDAEAMGQVTYAGTVTSYGNAAQVSVTGEAVVAA